MKQWLNESSARGESETAPALRHTINFFIWRQFCKKGFALDHGSEVGQKVLITSFLPIYSSRDYVTIRWPQTLINRRCNLWISSHCLLPSVLRLLSSVFVHYSEFCRFQYRRLRPQFFSSHVLISIHSLCWVWLKFPNYLTLKLMMELCFSFRK